MRMYCTTAVLWRNVHETVYLQRSGPARRLYYATPESGGANAESNQLVAGATGWDLKFVFKRSQIIQSVITNKRPAVLILIIMKGIK